MTMKSSGENKKSVWPDSYYHVLKR